MIKKTFIIVGLLLLLLVSCSSDPVSDPPLQQEQTFIPSPTDEPTAPAPLTLEEAAEMVINALAEKDLVSCG
jgi:hypothetical protein